MVRSRNGGRRRKAALGALVGVSLAGAVLTAGCSAGGPMSRSAGPAGPDGAPAAGHPAGSSSATVPPSAASPATTVPTRPCVHGTLRQQHHDAESGPAKPLVDGPVRRADWELWGARSAGEQPRQLATGMTDAADGTFTACGPDGTALATAYLRFRASSHNLWQVVDPKQRAVYAFQTAPQAAAGTVDVGAVSAPADQQGAWNVVDALGDLYRKAREANTSGSECWVARQKTGSCEGLTVTWAPGVKDEDGGYFTQEDGGRVVLATADADSRHTVLHEAGHWLQWQLYGREFPDVTNCENHTFETVSSPSCAWTEAFADSAAAYALGDHRYVYSTGDSVDLRNDKDWDRGDAVQGRIDAILLDLWAADGPDGGTWNRTIDLLGHYRPADFHEYFTVCRPGTGLPVVGRAGEILRAHSVDYR